MGRMVLDDVSAGRGAVVIDPKGDLIADLLNRLPKAAGPRTVLIDPADPGPHPSLNILAAGDPELLVDNLVGIFRRIFAGFWGPRTDDILRAACLTLLAGAGTEAPTLADVPKMLSDGTYRRTRVSRLPTDASVLRGFWSWYDNLSEPSRAAATGPLLNKLRAFLLRDFAAQLVARPASTVDLRQILDGGLILVRLPKGALGEETVRLLGSFIVAATWQAATGRAKTPENSRVDASPSTSTSAPISSTSPTRLRTCSPKPADTGSPWCSRTRTSPSCPQSCAKESAPTPATRSSSPAPRRTPEPWPSTPHPP
jgi:hypothetical protein